MTMLSRDDPNADTGHCQRCHRPAQHRHVSTFANNLRTWLCASCQGVLSVTIGAWLGLGATDGLFTWLSRRRASKASLGACCKCQAQEFYRNLSEIDTSTAVLVLDLCNPCQNVLTARVRDFIADYRQPLTALTTEPFRKV